MAWYFTGNSQPALAPAHWLGTLQDLYEWSQQLRDEIPKEQKESAKSKTENGRRKKKQCSKSQRQKAANEGETIDPQTLCWNKAYDDGKLDNAYQISSLTSFSMPNGNKENINRISEGFVFSLYLSPSYYTKRIQQAKHIIALNLLMLCIFGLCITFNPNLQLQKTSSLVKTYMLRSIDTTINHSLYKYIVYKQSTLPIYHWEWT